MKLSDVAPTSRHHRTAFDHLAVRIGRDDLTRPNLRADAKGKYVDPVRVDPVSGCWLWGDRPRYGSLRLVTGDGSSVWVVAHRVSYAMRHDSDLELKPGRVAAVVVDHRVGCPKRCVNPDHVSPATWRANVVRGRISALTPGQLSERTGLRWVEQERIWNALIRVGGRTVYLGRSRNEVEAGILYDAACLSLGGEPLNHERGLNRLPTADEVAAAAARIQRVAA